MEERQTLAVRFFHWWNAVSIFALIFSGFYIHNPYDWAVRWMFYDMDWARKVHFIFMYCVIAGLIGRLYYAFASGDYKNFSMGLKDGPNMLKLALYYLWITDEEPDWGGKYNPGQKGMYAAFAPLLLIQIYTGMILYWPAHFAWWGGWLGGIKWIREIHYIVAWVFVYCIVAHLYLDFSEGIANVVGMFTGKRPVHEHHHREPLVHREVGAAKG
jgi:Ni/Fe-hydrogenase 1 B-type cytochrome subunit